MRPEYDQDHVRIKAVNNGYILTMRADVPQDGYIETPYQTFVFNSAPDMAEFIAEYFPSPKTLGEIRLWEFK